MSSNIKDYSTTQASNTSLNGIDTDEGMLPSNLNNALRALMKNTRDWYNDSQWVEYGDGSGAFTAAYASGTSFTIAGANVTAIYHASRRIKLTATTPGTIYGTISSSSFSTNTTVNVTWDSGSLSSEAITNVYIGALSKTNSSIPTGIIGTTNIDDDAVTTAKIADGNITVAKMAVNSVDSDQYVDGSIDTVHIADSNITVAKMAANSVDSDQYVDGSIDTAHIGDDQITSAKIPDSAITSAKIADGAIVDADINASAAISLSKLENLTTARALVSDGSGDVSVSAVTATEIGYLDGVSSSIQTQLDAKGASNANLVAIGDLAKTDGNLIVGNGSTWVAESGATARTSLGLGSIATQAANNVSISGGSVTGLGEPSSNSDASTKSYVDQAVAGLRTRTIAECASTANVNISNALEAGDAIDGVTLVAGDRVLLKDQSTATENGLYIAVGSGAGAASRDPEHDTIAELSGGMVVVNQGSVNDNKIFLCTTDSDGSLGSTNITYTVITPSNTGTVTSIATGTGIDGGTITSTGTISIDSTVATLSGTQTLTNKTLTAPKIGTSILDTNGNELALLTATSSAVNEFTIANAATNNAPRLSATGETNVDLDLLAKGTGHVTIRGNNNVGTLQFNCEQNTHGQQLKAQPHSVGSSAVSTLPNVTGELIPGKIGGTNFTGSLILGHTTTGTLSSAEHNFAVGTNALNSISSGSDNIAIGQETLTDLTSGVRNIAIGQRAMANLIASGNNVVIGHDALTTSTNGGQNTSVGRESGRYITSGSWNVMMGHAAGDNITTGSGNVTIGSVTDVASATGNRQLTIGGHDGSATTTWITGDSSGNLVIPGTITANGVVLGGGGLDWQTIVTGSTLTAVAGRGYWIDTTSNTCTITLPSSANNGDQIIFADYARNWGTNKIIIDSNGLNYQGNPDTFTVEYNTSGETLNIVYSGATKGWIPLDDDSVELVGTPPPTQRGIFAFGNTGSVTGVSYLMNSSGVIGSSVSAVGSAYQSMAATNYGGDKAIFAFGYNGSAVTNKSNLVSNQGVVASDATGVGQIRTKPAGTNYGTSGQAVFAYGYGDSPSGVISKSNLVSSSGVVASDRTGVGTARTSPGGASYGIDKGIFGFGDSYASGETAVGMTNLVSNVGIISADVSAVGTVRNQIGATSYGGDKAIFAYGNRTGIGHTNISNKVSNTGVVASDTGGVGTARYNVTAAPYGGDKGTFVGGDHGTRYSIKNLISNSGVVASDTTGLGTATTNLGGAAYSFSA